MAPTPGLQSLDALNERFKTRAAPMKRIVVLTDIAFWEPGLGSHARITSMARALDACFDVTCFVFRTLTPKTRKQFAALGLRAKLVSYKDHTEPPSRGGTPFRKRLSSHPFLKAKAKDGWTQAAANYLAQERPDVVLLEYIDRSYLLDAIPVGTMTVLDTHDVMSKRTLDFARLDKKPSISMSAHAEASILTEYDAVIAISPSDAAALRGSLKLRNVIHSPHAALVAPPAVIREQARRLLFTGGNSDANRSGIEWFIDQVWPLVGAEFELHVVGSVCNAFETSSKNVIKHYVVDDLERMHAHCDIVINPVFIGGGIKIKTLEAMSYGLPCVTTREGARGLEDSIGEGLLVASQRLEFATLLMDIAGDRVRRAAISAAARNFMRERHYPSVAFRDLFLFINNA